MNFNKKTIIYGLNEGSPKLYAALERQGQGNLQFFDSRTQEEILALMGENFDYSTVEFGEFSQQTRESCEFIILSEGHQLSPEVKNLCFERSIPVISELELIMGSLLPQMPYVLVAGSSGKKTTSLLLQSMLEAEGKKVFSNVSEPLVNLLEQSAVCDFAIVRADCTQLEFVDQLKPPLSVLLNVSEEYTNYFQNYDELIGAYQRGFKNVDQESLTVLNGNDSQIALMQGALRSKKVYFSKTPLPEVIEGAWCEKDLLYLRPALGVQADSFNIKNFRMRGNHNQENLMAATLLARLLGVREESVFHTIDNFRAPDGRVQFLKRYNSVAFYNDSASTNVNALYRTINSFNEPIILITGDKEENFDYKSLIPTVRQKVKNLILFGDVKERMNRALGDFTETFLVGTLEEAVMIAYQKSRSGDVILFSPGTRPEAYKTLEERNEAFVALIERLSKPRARNVFV